MEDLWIFLTIIIVVSILAGAYQKRLKYGHLQRGIDAGSRDDDIDDLMRRVATLESIVTDRKSRLKDEIDNL